MTLLPAEDKNVRVWGILYEVQGLEDINAAIAHLAEREMITGGYHFDEVSFTTHKIFTEKRGYRHVKQSEVIPAQVYIAEPGNDQFVGDAPMEIQVGTRTRTRSHGSAIN